MSSKPVKTFGSKPPVAAPPLAAEQIAEAEDISEIAENVLEPVEHARIEPGAGL